MMEHSDADDTYNQTRAGMKDPQPQLATGANSHAIHVSPTAMLSVFVQSNLPLVVYSWRRRDAERQYALLT
jgi:hypothetical protein